MESEHSTAIRLENIVRKVISSDEKTSGYLSADHFKVKPFDAALIIVSALWKKEYNNKINDFLYKWDIYIRDKKQSQEELIIYANELSELVEEICPKHIE